MGCILLVGLVVKNGILLLDRAEEGREEGLGAREAVERAAAVRLRPILMTTLATLLGLVPLALGLGEGAELQRPLAITVLGWAVHLHAGGAAGPPFRLRAGPRALERPTGVRSLRTR